jgi:hypothetical protein
MAYGCIHGDHQIEVRDHGGSLAEVLQILGQIGDPGKL